jgi:hypothetical protein
MLPVPAMRGTGVPKLAPSTTNCTVPVGTPLDPLAALLTFAKKVTVWPKTDGFSEEVTTVVVPAVVTICPVLSVPLLLLKVLSAGTYFAVTVCGDPEEVTESVVVV